MKATYARLLAAYRLLISDREGRALVRGLRALFFGALIYGLGEASPALHEALKNYPALGLVLPAFLLGVDKYLREKANEDPLPEPPVS